MSNLNPAELQVLNVALNVIREETSGQFGFTQDVQVPGLSKQQVKGYLSQLSQKGMLRIWEDGQMMTTQAGVDLTGRTEWFEVAD